MREYIPDFIAKCTEQCRVLRIKFEDFKDFLEGKLESSGKVELYQDINRTKSAPEVGESTTRKSQNKSLQLRQDTAYDYADSRQASLLGNADRDSFSVSQSGDVSRYSNNIVTKEQF